MERFVWFNCVLLLLYTIDGSAVSLNDYELVEFHKPYHKRYYPSFYSWEGANIKDKAEPIEDEYVKYSDLDRKSFSSWLLRMNDAGRIFPNRINRESNENELSFTNERWLDIDLASRSPPFAPRLGRRNVSPFIPRLGRDDKLKFI
ncbi:uncharacterized protein LOC123322024 [Coccinella septempunctata]|uniref:uncharacterized protein LOC123322024 n=1 Tax=Coccinella septempunctata TaxID=41139 RepID=UPI001D06AE76|nr:uncharacterized protein LOC123322024 [Coccinella septempunctata]